MAGTGSDDVRAVVDPVVRAVGLDLEAVTITPAGRRRVVRVIVDGDDGLDLDAVAEVSTAISQALDGAELFGSAPYTLEVSSPGVDRPLTRPRHWRRARNRLVAVSLQDGQTLTGRLVESDSAAARIDVAGTVHEISLGDVGSARVQVEFARQPSAGPDATTGRDAADDAENDPDQDEETDVSQDLPEQGPGANPGNDVVGPEIDENAGRDADEVIEDLVDADPDTTDPSGPPVNEQVGTASGRSGAEVIGLDDDTAEDDPVELVVGPGTDDDTDRPVEDDLSDGEFDDGSDQEPLYADNDDDPTDLSAGGAREAADEDAV